MIAWIAPFLAVGSAYSRVTRKRDAVKVLYAPSG
jgi:hypothetical protein